MGKKTEMVELLQDLSMIKFQQKRVDRHPAACVTFEQDSKIEVMGSREREIYTIHATAHSCFYRLPHESETQRCASYRVALAGLVNVFYGEIRREVHKLIPLFAGMDNYDDRKTAEQILQRIEDMTSV